MSAIKGYNLSLEEIEEIKSEFDKFGETLSRKRELYITALENVKEKRDSGTISPQEFDNCFFEAKNLEKQLEIEERINKVRRDLKNVVEWYGDIRKTKRMLLSNQLHNMGFEYAVGFSWSSLADIYARA